MRLDVEPVSINPIAAVRSTLRNDQFLYFLPCLLLPTWPSPLMTATLPFWAGAVLLGDLPTNLATVNGASGHRQRASWGWS